MQIAGCELPRISVPRTSVNKGLGRKGRGVSKDPSPALSLTSVRDSTTLLAVGFDYVKPIVEVFDDVVASTAVDKVFVAILGCEDVVAAPRPLIP